MKKEGKGKIKTEIAIGIIVLFSLIVGITIYRAGSFSAAFNYIPQFKKKSQPTQEDRRILFASNGEKKVYKIQKDDGKWAVIVDGQEGEAYDDVFNPVFSDDGTQFAYGARNDDWEFAVLNNKARDKKYEKISQLFFGRDGVIIYKVTDDSGEYLVIGDEEGDKYTSIGDIVILDDGRIAYQAEIDGETVTVIDGEIVTGDDSSTETSESEDTIPDDAVVVESTPTIKTKTYRPKKDQISPVTDDSYPCEGAGCNF